MPHRTPPSFTSFTQHPPSQGLGQEGGRATRYSVERVIPVRGPGLPGVEAGQPLWRVEMAGRLPIPDAPFLGTSTHLVYTDSNTRTELTGISAAESGPVAVLIPIRKSAEWWALAQDQRQAYFEPGARSGHIAIGRVHAARIYRRLYHGRYLPNSEWDFLTYFEFGTLDRSVFADLLSMLRDPKHNPEWAFVDRELEIWMTRLD